MQAQTLNGATANGRNGVVNPEASEKYREALGLIQGLIKTIKSYRIYALNNPILTKFINEIHHQLTSYLEKHGSFRVSINEFAFIVDEEVIYEKGPGY